MVTTISRQTEYSPAALALMREQQSRVMAARQRMSRRAAPKATPSSTPTPQTSLRRKIGVQVRKQAFGPHVPISFRPSARLFARYVEDILDLVPGSIRSAKRIGDREAFGRAMVSCVLHRDNRLSYEEIGRAIGRHHTSVLHHVRRYGKLLPETGNVWTDLIEACKHAPQKPQKTSRRLRRNVTRGGSS